jgi:hypothetical protein
MSMVVIGGRTSCQDAIGVEIKFWKETCNVIENIKWVWSHLEKMKLHPITSTLESSLSNQAELSVYVIIAALITGMFEMKIVRCFVMNEEINMIIVLNLVHMMFAPRLCQTTLIQVP